eukprot:CAMPEP_0194058702 /NCGR_PEP_ID=MMETSP0009_2-20130614/67012_1 /TAXON_ID=210454 /ORGANISM="Grammatophora oceanica, Strain CCMP 410" /LENGTH=158 /DNA_ID=CAMNT_0038708977 /DNA_START=12 /DNA_END=488 /DNA_ORIENTATION=+
MKQRFSTPTIVSADTILLSCADERTSSTNTSSTTGKAASNMSPLVRVILWTFLMVAIAIIRSITMSVDGIETSLPEDSWINYAAQHIVVFVIILALLGLLYTDAKADDGGFIKYQAEHQGESTYARRARQRRRDEDEENARRVHFNPKVDVVYLPTIV